MEYQLVLQWPGSSLDDYDEMIALEERLDRGLTGDGFIDGHDEGEAETNIFILTENPRDTFTEVKELIGDHPRWKDVRIAYRELDGEKYTVLWPKGLKTFNVSDGPSP
jgi:hypothetical protein